MNKKQFQIILDGMYKANNSIRTYKENDKTWFIPSPYMAIAIPECLQIFNLDKTIKLESIDYFNREDIKELEITDIIKKTDKVNLHLFRGQKDNSFFDVWADEKFIKIFPEKEYAYYSRSSLTPIFCENYRTGEIEGMFLPCAPKKDDKK